MYGYNVENEMTDMEYRGYYSDRTTACVKALEEFPNAKTIFVGKWRDEYIDNRTIVEYRVYGGKINEVKNNDQLGVAEGSNRKD